MEFSKRPLLPPSFTLSLTTATHFTITYLNIRPSSLIQNSLARAVVRAPKSSHITPSLRSLHWLKIKERVDYKMLSLSCCLSPMRRNSVFEVLRVKRLADIQEDIAL